jgi:hypothetical protein
MKGRKVVVEPLLRCTIIIIIRTTRRVLLHVRLVDPVDGRLDKVAVLGVEVFSTWRRRAAKQSSVSCLVHEHGYVRECNHKPLPLPFSRRDNYA